MFITIMQDYILLIICDLNNFSIELFKSLNCIIKLLTPSSIYLVRTVNLYAKVNKVADPNKVIIGGDLYQIAKNKRL